MSQTEIITPAEERLAERERRLAMLDSVLEHVNQGISCFDSELTLQTCNARYLELLNFPAHLGIPGTPFEAFIRYNAERGEYGPGNVDEQVRARVEMARQPSAHRFERTRPDQTTLEIIGTPLDDGGFVTTYADITERKRHEQLIAESQHRLEMAMEAADLGLWDWDFTQNLLTFNPHLSRMLGEGETFATSWESMSLRLHPDDLKDTQAVLARHLAGETPSLECEYRIRDADDTTWVWLQIRGRIVDRSPEGRARRMIGTALDVSERKRNEALLKEREQRLAMLVKSLQDLIFVLDTGGTITECWPARHGDLGLEPARVVGQLYSAVLPPPLVEGLDIGIVEVLTGSAQHCFEFTREADGLQFYQVTVTPLGASGGFATGFLVMVRDVTEVHQLSAALAEAHARLAGKG